MIEENLNNLLPQEIIEHFKNSKVRNVNGNF